jgi:hypothetical protein
MNYYIVFIVCIIIILIIIFLYKKQIDKFNSTDINLSATQRNDLSSNILNATSINLNSSRSNI